MIHDLYSIPNHHSFPPINPLYQSIFPSPSTQRKTKYLSKKLNQYSNYQHKKRKTLLILFMMGFLICIFILYKGNSIQLKKINNKHTSLSSGSFLRTNENNPPRRLIDSSTPFPIHHSMFSFFIFNRTENLNRIHKMTYSSRPTSLPVFLYPQLLYDRYGYIVNKDLSILFITLKSIYTPHNKYFYHYESPSFYSDMSFPFHPTNCFRTFTLKNRLFNIQKSQISIHSLYISFSI